MNKEDIHETFKKEWSKYFRACYPTAKVGQTQYNETLQAFYGGALTFMVMIAQAMEGKSDDECVKWLCGMHEELEDSFKGFICRLREQRKR